MKPLEDLDKDGHCTGTIFIEYSRTETGEIPGPPETYRDWVLQTIDQTLENTPTYNNAQEGCQDLYTRLTSILKHARESMEIPS